MPGGDMGALDGARVGATGLAFGTTHALWPWPDQEARHGKNQRVERASVAVYL